MLGVFDFMCKFCVCVVWVLKLDMNIYVVVEVWGIVYE